MVKAINCRVIPVAAYMLNVCNFTGKELAQLDEGIKKILREHNMHGNVVMKIISQKGTWWTCYMAFSSSMWIKETWKWEVKLEGKSIKKEAEEALKVYMSM